jgi:hypothetical protein
MPIGRLMESLSVAAISISQQVLRAPSREIKPTRSKKLRFVSRNVRVEDITGLFATQLVLVAVLVAASGKETEKPLAIAPRWDVPQPLG